MRFSHLFILHWNILFSSVFCDKPCSREASRLVRDYFTGALGPIYEKNHVAIPLECVLSPIRDLFYRQELNKEKISNDKWLCKFCNKTFNSEFYLDLHFHNRHNDSLPKGDRVICLADYCPIFRCDALKKSKRSLRSLNPLARASARTRPKKKNVINEQQLTSLRTQCSSIINRCIPPNVHYDIRVKLQNQMYAEVCAYLTSKRYFELPNYRKPLVNFTNIFCLVVFLGMCLVGVGVVTHSDWKWDDHDEYRAKKLVPDETGSIESTMNSSDNGVNHTAKNPALSVRQRVRFKAHENDSQPGHSHGNGQHHHHEPT